MIAQPTLPTLSGKVRVIAVRVTLAVISAMAGYIGTSFSVAHSISNASLELASRLAPYDGSLTARLAVSVLQANPAKADLRRAERLARKSLDQDPTAIPAVTTIGIARQLRGDGAGARQAFGYSQQLSRRDLPTQLWAIEDAVARNDIPAALRHYDTALRVHPEASQLLFPVLASASRDPVIYRAVIQMIASKPPWWPSFVSHLLETSADPQTGARLIFGSNRAGAAVPESALSGAVNLLIGAKLMNEAWRYYAMLRPGVDRRKSRDPRFEADIAMPSQFDWVPMSMTGITASIQRGDEGGFFEFAASAGVGGTLLQQMQMLPAGTYRIAGHSIGIDQQTQARPYWRLRCQNGVELGRVNMPNSDQAGGEFSGTIMVPARCPIQALELVGRPSDAMSGLRGQIDRIHLEPVG